MMGSLRTVIAPPPPSPEAQISNAYDQYADAIFRHCYFRLFHRERAKELMQETFLKVWEYMQTGREIENLRAFLYRVANNLIIDETRKRHEQSLEALQEAGFDPTGSTGEEVTRGPDDKRVLEILGKLDKESRELVVMRYIDDLKPREIADILGIAPNTASVRIHRAMAELKELLKPLR